MTSDLEKAFEFQGLRKIIISNADYKGCPRDPCGYPGDSRASLRDPCNSRPFETQ